jgi:4-amino-4-deoxy-L-arabinose transferase-like glycosyltransferase
VERFVCRTRVLPIALGIALFALAIRAPLFDLPLERDEGEYAYIAWRLGAGETPYLDWFDQKPPGVFLAYRVALALPGDPVVAIRAVGALFCAGSAVALFALVRALIGTAAAGVAALLLVFLSADPRLEGPIANTEIFMAPWILVAALLSLRAFGTARPRFALGFAAGLSLGVAVAFKQVAAVNAPLLLALFWLRAPRGERLASTARFTGALAAGMATIWAAIALWFAARGGFAAALDAIVLHNLAYAADLPLAVRAAALAYYGAPLLPSQGVAWLFAAIGLAVLARRADRFPACFLGGFALANALGVAASGFFFPHYFQQLLPAIAALAAAAIAGAGEAVPRWRVAAGGALAIAPLAIAAIGFGRLDPAEASQRIYPDYSFDAMPAIGAEVAALTAPDERVFVFGAEPEVLFHARRVSASRYIFLFPVFGGFADADARQREVIAELEAAPPASIVWMPLPMFFGRGSQRLTEWTRAQIDAHYRLRAFAVAGADGRSELVRVASGADASAQLAGREPFARVFVRASP